jgi:predicted flap endonuclease-1-like 5' DNA nuclease
MSFFLISLLLLLGASVLGYAISRAWNAQHLSTSQTELAKLQRGYSKLREDYDGLIKQSNTLQSERRKLKNQIEANKNKLKHQREISRQLEHDKEFIFDEYENFRNAAKEKLEASKKMLLAFDSLKEKTQKEKIKTDKWKIKYHEATQNLLNVEAEARKLKKEKEALIEQSQNSENSSASIFEWETNYKELKLRYLALAKEKKDIESSLEEMEESIESQKHAENENRVMRLELQQLKKENLKLVDELAALIKSNKTKNKETVFDRIKKRSDQIDFKRIGKAFEHQKDDLKKLDGLGASMEKRFNSAGVFKFTQIASFNPTDEKLLNDLLELPKDKIQKANWVSQARKLSNREEDPQIILSRIGNRKDHVDFNRIGEASPTKKDNLQVIKGIGPFIEKKLNAIGIYHFRQIAYFNEEDIEEINDIIELGAGHIKTDDWVGQAIRMK